MHRRSDAFAGTDLFTGDRFDWRWASGYFLLLMILITGGVICLARGMWKERAGEPIVLLDRVNPNTATLGSLVRLEGIGEVRAYDIIQYRQSHAAEGRAVFACPQDLEAVHGIGPKTVEKLAPYLEFWAESKSSAEEP